MYFAYGETELAYLRKKDKRLCEVIDRVGHIDRTADPELFSSVIHHIIGQQISGSGCRTPWVRSMPRPFCRQAFPGCNPWA